MRLKIKQMLELSIIYWMNIFFMILKTGNEPEVPKKSWFLVFKRIFKVKNWEDDFEVGWKSCLKHYKKCFKHQCIKHQQLILNKFSALNIRLNTRNQLFSSTSGLFPVFRIIKRYAHSIGNPKRQHVLDVPSTNSSNIHLSTHHPKSTLFTHFRFIFGMWSHIIIFNWCTNDEFMISLILVLNFAKIAL